MEECPFCHTEVGKATVCKGCHAYKSTKASRNVEILVKGGAVLSGFFYGAVTHSFFGGLATGVVILVIGSVTAQRLFSKEAVWLRKF